MSLDDTDARVLSVPVGILIMFALVFSPFFLPIVLVGGTIGIVGYLVLRVLVTGLAAALNPEGHEAFKKAGLDPFKDSLGRPFNSKGDAREQLNIPSDKQMALQRETEFLESLGVTFPPQKPRQTQTEEEFLDSLGIDFPPQKTKKARSDVDQSWRDLPGDENITFDWDRV